jgi:hypothetical protein
MPTELWSAPGAKVVLALLKWRAVYLKRVGLAGPV